MQLNIHKILKTVIHSGLDSNYKTYTDHKQERVQNSFVQNEQNCHAVTKSVLVATNGMTNGICRHPL